MSESQFYILGLIFQPLIVGILFFFISDYLDQIPFRVVWHELVGVYPAGFIYVVLKGIYLLLKFSLFTYLLYGILIIPICLCLRSQSVINCRQVIIVLPWLFSIIICCIIPFAVFLFPALVLFCYLHVFLGWWLLRIAKGRGWVVDDKAVLK